jgi:hypothetical protein
MSKGVYKAYVNEASKAMVFTNHLPCMDDALTLRLNNVEGSGLH